MNKRTYNLISGLALVMMLPFGCGGAPPEDNNAPVLPAKGGKKDGSSTVQSRKGSFPGQKATTAGTPVKVAAAPPGPNDPLYNDPRIRTLGNTHGNNDPFKITWRRPIPPPYIFSELQPIRVASASVEVPPPQDTEIRELPMRRVSGILEGDGVYAILEGPGGDPEIVKPGSLTRDNYKVVSITSNTVKLERRIGRTLLVQSIQLSDLPSGGVRNAGFNPGSGGGMMGGGRPGIGAAGGGRRGGKGDGGNLGAGGSGGAD